jgi:hypothetical protein
MSITFTKLFTSITESTLWQEDDQTRLTWITMLAMADKNGRVFAAIPGLASRARVPLESAEKALERFLSPDPYSRTPDHEGRRIEKIDGGWRLLNHAKYRELRDEEAIRESKRAYINNRRAKEREAKSLGVTAVPQDVENVERCRHNAEADTDAEAEANAESEAEAIKSARPLERGHSTIKSSPHFFKKKSTGTSSDDALDRSLEASECSEERIQFIRKFNDHARLNPRALLPITVYTEELASALDVHEDDCFEDLSATIEQEVKAFDGPANKRLTLVRLVWGNH